MNRENTRKSRIFQWISISNVLECVSPTKKKIPFPPSCLSIQLTRRSSLNWNQGNRIIAPSVSCAAFWLGSHCGSSTLNRKTCTRSVFALEDAIELRRDATVRYCITSKDDQSAILSSSNFSTNETLQSHPPRILVISSQFDNDDVPIKVKIMS